jgi:hypothetical protein
MQRALFMPIKGYKGMHGAADAMATAVVVMGALG